ncbi:MAG: zf-HC2 domain-containing protein [Polaromonas sp.]|nr:zf-HC2 domain-containing protein [Polaromonas sp.]
MKFTVLRRTCKQAAALLVAREDRALNLPDTVALRLHLMACKACPQFENQILTMRKAMAQWRQAPDETDGETGTGQP